MTPPKLPGTYSEKLEHVITLIEAIQLVGAAEAIALGVNVGLDPQKLYSIICGAAGNSRMFEERVPQMLAPDTPQLSKNSRSLTETINRLSNTLRMARMPQIRFGAPLASSALQILYSVSRLQTDEGDDSTVFKFWGLEDSAVKLPEDDIATVVSRVRRRPPRKVAFIGLGSMGFGMATVLRSQGVRVVGYDSYAPAREAYSKDGGDVALTVKEAAQDAEASVFMTVSLDQTETVLFDESVIDEMPLGATVILCLTAPPSDVLALRKRIDEKRPDLHLVDAPVSGGATRAANGTLSIIASSACGKLPAGETSVSTTGLEVALPLLDAMTGRDGKGNERLFLFPGKLGQGNSVKMINQLLAGLHIAATAEGIAFAYSLGLEDELTRVQQDCVKAGAGFMMENRMERVVNHDPKVESKIDIFVKDLSIVANEACRVHSSTPMASLALTKFLDASANGWGNDDDSSVIRLWHHFPLFSPARPRQIS